MRLETFKQTLKGTREEVATVNPIGHVEVAKQRERELRDAAEAARRIADGHRGPGRRETSPPRRPAREDR
jgi:hypothetical protein